MNSPGRSETLAIIFLISQFSFFPPSFLYKSRTWEFQDFSSILLFRSSSKNLKAFSYLEAYWPGCKISPRRIQRPWYFLASRTQAVTPFKETFFSIISKKYRRSALVIFLNLNDSLSGFSIFLLVPMVLLLVFALICLGLVISFIFDSVFLLGPMITILGFVIFLISIIMFITKCILKREAK